jgi:hypothetical protein
MASHLGYEHVRKTPESPATLAIYEPEAAVVRTMFEKFATNGAGGRASCKCP